MPREGLGALAAACVGTVVVLAYALWAAWQILVLNPLAAVPGRTLGQIFADMTAANESYFLPIVWAVLSIGPALAAVFLILSVTIWRVGPWALTSTYLALVIMGIPGYFIASFAPGMALADTYPPLDGGDHSPWAGPLFLVSAVAVVALAGVGVGAMVRAAR